MCMKPYLSDEKTHVDPCPHIGILLGLDSNDKTNVISLLHLYYLMVLTKLISTINLLEHKKIAISFIFVSQNLIIIKIYLLISVKGYSGIIPFKH